MSRRFYVKVTFVLCKGKKTGLGRKVDGTADKNLSLLFPTIPLY